jgi:hypothetical protein
MRIESTNFEGDWDSECPFCGATQRAHQVSVGELDGVKYVHRMPCEKEQYQIRKRAVAQGIALRTILWIFDFAKYVWSRIPFKKEMRLIYEFFKNIAISIRALLYLGTTKPK